MNGDTKDGRKDIKCRKETDEGIKKTRSRKDRSRKERRKQTVYEKTELKRNKGRKDVYGRP